VYWIEFNNTENKVPHAYRLRLPDLPRLVLFDFREPLFALCLAAALAAFAPLGSFRRLATTARLWTSSSSSTSSLCATFARTTASTVATVTAE